MQKFRDLKVWAKSHALVLVIYEMSEAFPPAERFGLTAQVRRAATSIPTNIAEGCGRSTSADFGRFLHIAMGSASELEYLLLLARDLRMVASDGHDRIAREIEEVKKMLHALIRRTKSSLKTVN